MMAQDRLDINQTAKRILTGSIILFLAALFGCCLIQLALTFEPPLPSEALQATNAANIALYNQTQTAVAVEIDPPSPSVDPKADVLKAYELQQSTFPQRITQGIRRYGSVEFVQVHELVGPDVRHMLWQEDGLNREAFLIKGRFYVPYNSQWVDVDQFPIDIPFEIAVTPLGQWLTEGLTQAAYLGLDSCFGIEVHTYSYEMHFDNDIGYAGKVWVRTDSGLPCKTTMHPLGLDDSVEEFIYEYGIEVTITPPIP